MTGKKKRTIILAIAAVLLALVVWTVWGNTALELNTYTVGSKELPDAFDGYRIAHVSDLHNAEMGDGNEKLLAVLREADPDIIAITGDLIDSRNTNIEVALAFAEKAMKIAPCYYVTGNHEARVSECAELKAGLEAAGVVVLENERGEIELSGETITILGVDDPSFNTDYLFGDSASVVSNTLAEISTEDDGFAVLLSHRPELFVPMWLVAWIWLLAAMPMEGNSDCLLSAAWWPPIRACSRSMILVYTPRVTRI